MVTFRRRGAYDRESDLGLLRRARDGDAEAFGAFFRRRHEVVLAFLVGQVGSADAAADLLDEVFCTALIAVHDHERELPELPLAWTFGVARNKLLESYRKGRVQAEARQRLALEPVVLDDDDIERITAVASETDVIALLREELPEDQVQALCARVLQEREYAEIAAELDCSESVVRQRVSRGLRTLRGRMETTP